jgi:transcriptional regulator with XRE-family HTH domain
MGNRKRQSRLEGEAVRRLRSVLEREGSKIRAARLRRQWTQAELARRSGLTQPTVSRMERGEGSTLSLATWQRVALVLDLPFEIKLGRDALELPADAGHLAIQDLILRLGRTHGHGRTFELQTRSSDPMRSTDVGLVDHKRRRLVRVECVNSFGNIGDAVRSSDRKGREAEGLAISLGHGEPYSMHECWVIRSTRRNREILTRYPEIFASRFTGSSRAWVQALATGCEPPREPGLVWCDTAPTRLFDWRHDSVDAPLDLLHPPAARRLRRDHDRGGG